MFLEMSKKNDSERGGWIYRGFRNYVIFINSLYYPKIYSIGVENLPKPGEPTLLVGNHQNCLNDPLNTEIVIKDRKPYCMVRSDVFKNKLFCTLLDGLGLLPVSRLSFEGKAAMAGNDKTFEVARRVLSEGKTLMLFPESGHQDKRWLGYFSLAYLKLAFEAAETAHFEKEIYIQPFAHHYEEYFHPRYDMMVQFGTPIALSPYYAKYKEKPRTTIREVNSLVEKQIGDMMLNITDLDNYTAIDYLRSSELGREYARKDGRNPNYVVDKLASDKQLFAALEAAKAKAPEAINNIYKNAREVDTETRRLGMRDWVLAKRPGMGNLMARLIVLLVTLPLFISGLALTWPVFLVPKFFHRLKINGAIDPMFISSFNVGSMALVTFPLCCFIPALVMLCCGNWLGAIGHVISFVLMVLFVIYYQRWFAKFRGVWNFHFADKKAIAALTAKRDRLFNELKKHLYNIG
ncbi:MAG: hypothetical protein E7091_11570 [Bacteroidales bacterium]|nr:hypothetical protein [Bacteroidales bacterium]